MLDNNFITMSNFLSLAATGKCGTIPENVDISAVLKYASEHAVVPLVASGIQKLGIYADELIANQIQSIALQMVARNIQSGFVVRSIIESFNKENIKYALLKGESLAALYAEPDFRISGDIDLLVSGKDERKALKILDKFDYYYQKRPEWGNETVAKHDKYKTIEIHTALFDESRNDIFFNNILSEPKEFIKINTANYGEVSVLSPNDGILFIFFHFVKHFLSSGAGIRQLMDVVVYSRHYLKEIEWSKFFDLLKQIRYYKLYTYIVSVAIVFLGIPENDLPEVEIDRQSAIKVLEDLQNGGIFGYNEKELAQFKKIYERKRYNTFMSGNYESYEKKFRRSKFRLVFPGLSYMKRNYLYVKKCPALIVIAWIDRMIKAFGKLLSKKRKVTDYFVEKKALENTKINDRMKLMEELGLL